MSKEINVPLTWEEIDNIIISLRLTNKAFKGDMRDELEEKMSDYSMKAKLENNKQLVGCKDDCIYLSRPTYDYPCNSCVTNQFKQYSNK